MDMMCRVSWKPYSLFATHGVEEALERRNVDKDFDGAKYSRTDNGSKDEAVIYRNERF